MTLLYLIRHARTTWNAEGRMQGQADPPLDELGLQQAHALAARLRSETLHAVYSSPLLRARQTAEILAASHNLMVDFDDRLKERHLGEWTGLTGDEVRARFPDFAARDWRTEGPPGGENQVALGARAIAALTEIVAAHPNETAAVISHGGILSAYAAHMLGIPAGHAISFPFQNTAIARLRVQNGRIDVLSIGDDRHLDLIQDPYL
jgi:probable phosphoglycerate mutase